MTSYFLGIDAGGSHCCARLTDATGKVLGTGETGPANARIGIEKLRTVLMEACDMALGRAARRVFLL